MRDHGKRSYSQVLIGAFGFCSGSEMGSQHMHKSGFQWNVQTKIVVFPKIRTAAGLARYSCPVSVFPKGLDQLCVKCGRLPSFLFRGYRIFFGGFGWLHTQGLCCRQCDIESQHRLGQTETLGAETRVVDLPAMDAPASWEKGTMDFHAGMRGMRQCISYHAKQEYKGRLAQTGTDLG